MGEKYVTVMNKWSK